MKKWSTRAATALLAAVCLSAGAPAFAETQVDDGYDYTRFADDNITLNVYNWGEYISDGSEDTLDVVAEFEALTGIRVNYTTFDTNESLYAKLKSGGGAYDVIIPSDYMIGKMANEGMLEELDFSNIPNYDKYIGDAYKNQSYDPENKYSVPYMWGLVCVIYNTTMVDEGDTSTGWGILWDEKYAGQILMFNNSRDAFAIAGKMLGGSLNPSSVDEVEASAEKLKQQKSVVQAYVMDEIFDKMGGDEAAVAPYYVGDGITMMEDNPDLAMYLPGEGWYSLTVEFEDGRFGSISGYESGSPFMTNIALKNGSRLIEVKSDFFQPFIANLVDFFRTGEPKVPARETLRIMAVRGAGLLAQKCPGEWVAVEAVSD